MYIHIPCRNYCAREFTILHISSAVTQIETNIHVYKYFPHKMCIVVKSTLYLICYITKDLSLLNQTKFVYTHQKLKKNKQSRWRCGDDMGSWLGGNCWWRDIIYSRRYELYINKAIFPSSISAFGSDAGDDIVGALHTHAHTHSVWIRAGLVSSTTLT